MKTVALGVVAALVIALCVWTAKSKERSTPANSGRDARGESTRVRPAPGASAFTDVTLSAGIDFVHSRGATGQYYLCEVMSGGGAFLDYNNDGLLDIYLVQSGVYGEQVRQSPSRLYRNEGDGRFTDVTESSHADTGPGYGVGCAAADYDYDGFIDLYITRVGPDILLHNNRDGTFSDVTAQAGLGNPGFCSSAAWFDFDRDGWLDLYVARDIEFSPEAETPCRDFAGNRDYCGPTSYPMPRHLLYRNLGDGRFEDVSAASGIKRVAGYGLAVTCSDFDSDGWLDVYVANDQSPAMLWRNQRNGTFKDESLLTGCAYNGDGQAIAGMGIAAEDYDADGDFDLFVTNLRQNLSLFLRNERGMFEDVSAKWGQVEWMISYTGFGVAVFDQDHDGRFDMFVANGDVLRHPDPLLAEEPYAQPNLFLRRDTTGRFVSAAAEVDPQILSPAVSRGVAFGDYDNDGDIDLLVCRNEGRPQLLRNEQNSSGHWLSVATQDLQGKGPVLNARVTVEAAGRRWIREVRPHQSYLTTSDPRVHFGLGEPAVVDRIEVLWPDGRRESWRDVPANQFFTARCGSGIAETPR